MPTKKAPTQPHMSPAHLLRRLAMSTSADPKIAALRARLLPTPGAQADPKKGTGDTVEKAMRDETPRGPKRRKTVTVKGKHGTYQSTRMVGSDKPAAAQGTGPTRQGRTPAAAEAPAAKPTLAFSKGRAATGTLNGVPFAPWADVPTDNEGWAQVDGQDAYLEEPAVPELTEGYDGKPKGLGSGVIIQEPDGRVWLCKPTNSFGGYKYTFPKGGAEDGLSLQANAIKECFEESGLQVRITGFAGDIERSTSVARYYFAQRVGGSPTEHGWESEGVVLVDPANLHQFLNVAVDQKLAHAHAGAPEPPPKPKSPTMDDYHAAMKAKYGDAYDPKYKPKSSSKSSSKPKGSSSQGGLFSSQGGPSPSQGGLFPGEASGKAPASMWSGKPSTPNKLDLALAAAKAAKAQKPWGPNGPSVAPKKLPSLSDLKKTVPLLPPGIPNAYALSTKNGPAFQELLDVQNAVKAGELSPAEGAMLAGKVPATDPTSNSATALDFQRKRLVAYLTQQAGPQA